VSYWAHASHRAVWAHADYTNRTIGLNPRYWGKPAAFQREISAAAASGWHPKDCKAVESILTHEFGHWVQFAASNDRAIAPFISADDFGRQRVTLEMFIDKHFKELSRLSQYAKTNRAEAWAEAFTALYHTPPEKQAAVLQQMGKLVELLKSSNIRRDYQWVDMMKVGDRPAASKYLEDLKKELGL